MFVVRPTPFALIAARPIAPNMLEVVSCLVRCVFGIGRVERAFAQVLACHLDERSERLGLTQVSWQRADDLLDGLTLGGGDDAHGRVQLSTPQDYRARSRCFVKRGR